MSIVPHVSANWKTYLKSKSIQHCFFQTQVYFMANILEPNYRCTLFVTIKSHDSMLELSKYLPKNNKVSSLDRHAICTFLGFKIHSKKLLYMRKFFHEIYFSYSFLHKIIFSTTFDGKRSKTFKNTFEYIRWFICIHLKYKIIWQVYR